MIIDSLHLIADLGIGDPKDLKVIGESKDSVAVVYTDVKFIS